MPDLGLGGLLDAVRRERYYAHLQRPVHEKVLGGGAVRPNIFDEGKVAPATRDTRHSPFPSDPPPHPPALTRPSAPHAPLPLSLGPR